MNPEQKKESEDHKGRVGDTDQGDDMPTPKFLLLPLILKKILSNLPTSDLLTCALVCKAWNYEARCVLRDSRTLVASIEAGESPCSKLKEFDTFLSNLSVVPYSGMSVCVEQRFECSDCFGSQNLEEFYPSLLKMNLKYLKIDWELDDQRWEQKSCSFISLLQKWIQVGRQLEHVYLKNLPDWLQLYNPSASNNMELPKLKTLRLGRGGGGLFLRENGTRRIVELAPNLEQLYATIFPADVLNGLLPFDKVKCITDLFFTPWSQLDLDVCEQIALSGAKLQKLYVCSSAEMNLDRTWRILKLLLESNKDSLDYLKVDLVGAMKLTGLLQLPLNGLQKLEVWLDCTHDDDDLSLVPLLENIDFGRLFPDLKSLMLTPRNSHNLNFLQQFFTAEELPQGEQFAQKYTGELILRNFWVPQTIAATFPNIQSLHGYPEWMEEPPYRLLWETWPKLERLVIMECAYRYNSERMEPFLNLDAEFCGISLEEAAELETKDEEFLEKVHIVPTRPAITCLRNLKEFKLRIRVLDVYRSLLPTQPNDLFLLSKVTGCVAFRRMHSRVDMRMDVGQGILISVFKHMKPYIDVVEGDMYQFW